MADTNNQNSFLDYAGLALFWSNIKKIIEDNELVTATALTDLDTRVDTLEGLSTTPIISKTYSELKTLRDNSQLIPGQQYTITDYATTVNDEYLNNGITVAGDLHLFDIVVTANSSNGFYEVARAVYNPNRDTYFENSNLDAWKIWYCFDNDQDRFSWATANGTGVIYRMIDEWNNDCPYDFKNIVMEDRSSTLPGGGLYYTFTVLYDDGESGRADASLYGYCHNNTIKPACDFDNGNYTYFLNANIFISYDVTVLHENFLDYGCRNNVFGYNCNSNKLGTNCYGNNFGNECNYNTFGNYCNSNSFGDYCESNTFGDACSVNTFGNYCGANSFGVQCTDNIFSNYCDYNSFMNSCSNNSFADECISNILGNYCEYNSLGYSCYSNIFGNYCGSNNFRISGDNTSSLIGYCRYNSFDDGCSYNIIYSANTNSSNYLENYHINRGVKGTYGTPMLIDAQYLSAENVCNVYKKGDIAVVAYIQY